LLSGGDNLAR